MPNTAYNCDNVLKPYIGYSGGDIIFNRNVAWDDVSTTDEGGYLDYQYHDFESVVLHELGHFMGLGHIPETNSAMSSVVYNASQKRNLNNCDIKALQDLYPNTIPLQLPCSSFVQGTEGDTGSQNPGTSSGSGGTGNNCRIITNPNHFSPEVIRGVFEFFGQGNIRKHINMFSAQIVANQSQFDKIITSSEARYKPVQDALMNAVIANQNLMDRTFAKKENPIVTNINLDPPTWHAYSKLPKISSLIIFPAIRTLKISPIPKSKIGSTGVLESIQLTTAASGYWLAEVNLSCA